MSTPGTPKRKPMQHKWLNAAVFAGSILVAACGSELAPEVAFHRFADPMGRVNAEVEPNLTVFDGTRPFDSPLSTAPTPRETIRHDTRPVLAAFPTQGYLHQRARAGPDGRATVVLPLEASLAKNEELWVHVQLLSRDGVRDGPVMPIRGNVIEQEGSPAIRFTLKLEPRGRAFFHVTVHDDADSGETRFRSAPIGFPRDATLRFAMGFAGDVSLNDPVRFTVSMCAASECELIFEESAAPASVRQDGWLERSVGLPAVEDGEERVFVFDTAGTERSRPVWGDPTIYGRRSRPADARNVILLSIDTLRADHLGFYGYERATSPFLDELSARSLVVERMIAESATTDSSHMTMFTSLPSPLHGVDFRTLLAPIAVPVVTLAEAFRSEGFDTAAFTENGPLLHARGFELGFARYVENVSPDIRAPVGLVKRTLNQARAWLSDQRDRPFFLFLHTFQVHAPYRPPKQYGQLFGKQSSKSVLYDREIRYVDAQLRDFVNWLASEGVLDDTILVILSDHGEEFHEHGNVGHATLPYETVLHVPLLFAGSGLPVGRLAGPFAHIDLMPTLLELAGVRAPNGLHGSSFASQVLAGTNDIPVERALFSTSWVTPAEVQAPATAVRHGNYKLIQYRVNGKVRNELYDLASDQDEQLDLSRAEPEITQRLNTLLADRKFKLRFPWVR